MHCTATCSAAVHETALQHCNAAANRSQSTSVGVRIDTVHEGDACYGESGVPDVENCTGRVQTATAVEYCGGRHAADNKQRKAADIDGRLEVDAGSEAYARTAAIQFSNGVSDGFAGCNASTAVSVAAILGVNKNEWEGSCISGRYRHCDEYTCKDRHARKQG